MDESPKVVGGKLDRPYPIKTAGDVQRARVLPPPRTTSAPGASGSAAPAPRPIARDEQPKSAVDYVKKRNALQREITGRR